MTAATFSILIPPGETATPNRSSMFASVCAEKIVCRRSPVLFRPTTSPYPISGCVVAPCSVVTSLRRETRDGRGRLRRRRGDERSQDDRRAASVRASAWHDAHTA